MRSAKVPFVTAASAGALSAVFVIYWVQNPPRYHHSLDRGDEASSTSEKVAIEIRSPGATSGVTSSELKEFESRRVIQSDGIANGKYRAIAVDDG